jgi:hypothetical protein
MLGRGGVVGSWAHDWGSAPMRESSTQKALHLYHSDASRAMTRQFGSRPQKQWR